MRIARCSPNRVVVVAALLVIACQASAARASVLRADVPIAPVCLAGAFPATITAGGATFPGTLTVAPAEAGALAASLVVGADVFELTGRQTVRKGALAVVLKGRSGSGDAIRLKGTAAGTTLGGAIAGRIGGAKLPRKSRVEVDLTGALPFVVRAVVDVAIDPSSGSLTGTGTARACGSEEVVTLTGSSTHVKTLPEGKAAKARIAIAGTTFTLRGKGDVLLDDEAEDVGYALTWKARVRGVRARGKNLRLGPVPTGRSPGTLAVGDAVGTRFNPVASIDVPVLVRDAVPSADPMDWSVTLNDDAVPADVAVDLAQGIVTLRNVPLVAGANALAIAGRDAAGLVLAGAATVWAGDAALVVAVRDESDQPVAGATVTVRLGDDQQVSGTGTTDGAGQVTFDNIPDRTILVEGAAAGGAWGTASGVGSAGLIPLILEGFDPPSPVANNDFATGDASGWSTGTAPVSIVVHEEAGGPLAATTAAVGPAAADDFDMVLNTAGEGPQQVSRTFVTQPNTVAVRLRYRFVTSEVPGGYFGTKWNDAFSVSIRSQTAGGVVSESSTMNGLGLAAFDAGGATAWREATLPLAAAGDTVQVDVTVANVGDGLFDSYVIIDQVAEISIDLTVANPTRLLLETNRFEIVVDPPGTGSDFKIEIRRASAGDWFTLGTNRVEESYKQRVAGKFKLRGRAMIDGREQTTPEKDLEVQFPAYADIVANATVVSLTDTAWTNTKNAANATSRREEGFFILLDTNAGAERYTQSPTVIGPSVGPMQTGSVNIVKPPDVPAMPTPVQAAVYAVASFHTHTPTRFRPVGRAVAPSAADQNADTSDGVPGVVYDYVGVGGIAPAGHPLNSPAQRYPSGPARRMTPP